MVYIKSHLNGIFALQRLPSFTQKLVLYLKSYPQSLSHSNYSICGVRQEDRTALRSVVYMLGNINVNP